MPEIIEHVAVGHYLCDECNIGRMYPTGNLFSPNLIEHQCNHCGDIQNFDKCYSSMLADIARGS